jgi:hypothetical protein
MYKLWQQIKWIIFLLCLLATVIFTFSCTPQKRLNRLLKNHPQLADTVYSVRTVTVPGLSIDTFFVVQPDTVLLTQNLDSILSKYLFTIDSLNARSLSNDIKNYIIKRPCLTDTLEFVLPGRGWVKVWQTGGNFAAKAHLNQQPVTIKVPSAQFKVTYKRPWAWLGGGILIGWFMLFIVVFAFFKTKPPK